MVCLDSIVNLNVLGQWESRSLKIKSKIFFIINDLLNIDIPFQILNFQSNIKKSTNH